MRRKTMMARKSAFDGVEHPMERRSTSAAKQAAETRLAAMHGGRARGEGEGQRGGVVLPDSCLQRILCCLAEQAADPCGLVGPCLAARDIANASLACWDLYHASKHAFAALADYVERVPFEWVPDWQVRYNPPPLTDRELRYMSPADLRARRCNLRLKLPGSLGWGEWDRVLGSPADLTLEQLAEAARIVGAKVTGTKAQLILWILEALGLAAPPSVPAKLLRACAAECTVECIELWGRPQPLESLFQGGSALRQRRQYAPHLYSFKWWSDSCSSLAGLRAAVAADGITTRAAFDAAVADAQEWLDVRQRERIAQATARLRRMIEAAALHTAQHAEAAAAEAAAEGSDEGGDEGDEPAAAPAAAPAEEPVEANL